jgi:TetR/AcrR family fatty acid metabolism transcriptional regulator
MKRALFGALDEMGRYWILSSRRKHKVEDAARQISEVFIRGVMTEEARATFPWSEKSQ